MKNGATGRHALLEFGMVLAASLILTGSLAGTAIPSVTNGRAVGDPSAASGRPIGPNAIQDERATDPNSAATSSSAPVSAPETEHESAPEPTPGTAAGSRPAPAPTSMPVPAIPASGPADPGFAPLARPVVILYGDSLAWEARHVFEAALAAHLDIRVVTRTFGGTAICDWLDEMAADAIELQPGLVVIEFVGNNFTPCMRSPDGAPLAGTALIDRYTSDAEAAVATFGSIGSQVVFAGAPVSRAGMGPLTSSEAPLNNAYAELASDHPDVHFVDAGSAVLADGRWTATLPCLPEEPCDVSDGQLVAGHTPVRAPDTLHFCPAADADGQTVTGDCPVWSSGAYRYGTAMAQPVLDSIEARRP